MPDQITSTGIEVETFTEIRDALVVGLQGIYGADINVDQNSPDGQLVNIFTQSGADIRELAVQIYNNFDPDQASGTVLDQRAAINNVTRQGGSFTIQPIDIVVSGTVFLQGLDAAFDSLTGTGYTIQDNAGNQFILIDSVTLTAGTSTQNFRAAKVGLVETIPNTITNQVTVVLGVSSVNNSGAALTVGQNQETDPQLRVRRQQSTAINSSGYLNGLLGTVLDIPGVTQAQLYENDTASVDGNGIPAHGTWLIVENGANSDIAQTIYAKKSYGSNQKGSVTQNITTASGATFTARFDRPIGQRLYVKFNLKKLISSIIYDTAAIAANMAANVNFYIGQPADMGSMTVLATNAVSQNGGGGVVLDMLVSTNNATWVDYIATATLAGQFTLAGADIAITVV